MIHHSYLSPDGRWVLMVSMDSRGALKPCQVVPFDGSGNPRVVGPPQAACISGAWSPDGKWIYVSADPDGRFHIWRQRFPDGGVQQVTSGTTDEEGIAMSADGESLLTSVGTDENTIWLHDATGDHQLSSEGSAFGTTLSRDKNKLYYFLVQNESSGVGLWVRDLAGGGSELIASGAAIQPGGMLQQYSISQDGKTAALSIKDGAGRSQIWLTALDHRSSPRLLSSPTSQDSASFLPNGDLILRSIEGSQNFLYRIHPDGTGRQKAVPDPVLDLNSISPDGRWALTTTKTDKVDPPAAFTAYPLAGGSPVLVCTTVCSAGWDITGKRFYVVFLGSGGSTTYLMPVNPARGMPDLPAGGIAAGDDLKKIKGVLVIPQQIDSIAGPGYYSYTHNNARRNIYRIPLTD
jgi:Tol biopolymer transport system component